MAELGFPVLPMMELTAADFPTPPEELFERAAAALAEKRAREEAVQAAAAVAAAAAAEAEAAEAAAEGEAALQLSQAASAAAAAGARPQAGAAAARARAPGGDASQGGDELGDSGSAAARTAGVASPSGRSEDGTPARSEAEDLEGSDVAPAPAGGNGDGSGRPRGWAAGQQWTFPPGEAAPAAEGGPGVFTPPQPPPPQWEPVPGLGAGLWADEPWFARLRAWTKETLRQGPEARLVVRPRSGGGVGARVAGGIVEAAVAAHTFVMAVRAQAGQWVCCACLVRHSLVVCPN